MRLFWRGLVFVFGVLMQIVGAWLFVLLLYAVVSGLLWLLTKALLLLGVVQ